MHYLTSTAEYLLKSLAGNQSQLQQPWFIMFTEVKVDYFYYEYMP